MKHIIEARRYLDNAREILREKAIKRDCFYLDHKYVKLAGHAAYTGVLVALDGFFGAETTSRRSVEWYRKELSKYDKKILQIFNSAYEMLHLYMGYDGALNTNISIMGL